MIIRRDALKAVLPATTKDDSRYYLHAIQIEPDGRCVATDGHVLLTAIDRAPFDDTDFPAKGVADYKGNPDKTVSIDAGAIEKLIAAMPKQKKAIPILQAVQLSTNGDGGAVVSATDLDVPCVVHLSDDQAGRFPDWRRLMPRDDRPALKVTLAVNVLQALIKAAQATQRGMITFELPTEPQYQGTRPAAHEYEESPDVCSGPDCPCVQCGKVAARHVESDGHVINTVRVRIKGEAIDVDGVVMPCRR